MEEEMPVYRGPVPLEGRVELFSNEWVAAAEAELRRLVRLNKAKFENVSHSLCETFEDAPPHLGLKDNVASCTLRFSRGEVTIEQRRDPEAEFQVSGHYQAVMPVGHAVGPTAVQRAIELTRHLFGDRALRATGRRPPTAVRAVLSELHDHLARRTVENPDLGHRVRAQGLETKVRQLAEDGYTVLESAISLDLASELRDRSIEVMISHKGPNTGKDHLECTGLITRGRPFEEIVQHPTLRTVIESCLGPAMILQRVSCAMRAQGPSVASMHADHAAMPEPFALHGVAVWALDDWTEEAGPIWVIPGSQKRRRVPTPSDIKEGGVPILLGAGSVMFLAQGVWHWQSDRAAAGNRVTLHSTYQRPFMPQADDFSNIDGVLYRNSPVLRRLTGHDDLFRPKRFLRP